MRRRLLWEEGAVGEAAALCASLCDECARVEFPALADCPACGGASPAVALGPEAVLHGATEVLHPPPDGLVPVPYTIATASFPGTDLAVMGLLEAHVSVAELSRGLRLEVCVVAYGDGQQTYGFRPA